jgi:DNA-binding beta-propeller fold protein YncE
MNFLPPIRADIISGHRGNGGIAVNVDGTLVASVDCGVDCVYIYNVADRDHTAYPAIVGTAHGLLNHPEFACFVRYDGVDTLLISDWGNDRVVEVTACGVFLRAIALPKRSRPWGIAERDGVIAVSLSSAHAVVLLQYETGAVKPEATIGSGTGAYGRGDGQLHNPHGVTFTADGCHILVADWGNRRVSKFSAASGAFIAHVISNGITFPRDVLQCEDGSIVVAHQDGVTCVGKDGVTVQNITISSGVPSSLSYSPSSNGVVVKRHDGVVFVLRDAWSCSLRCEWVQACVHVRRGEDDALLPYLESVADDDVVSSPSPPLQRS